MRGRNPEYYIEKRKPNWRTLSYLLLFVIYATIYETSSLIYVRIPVLLFVIFIVYVFFEHIEEQGFTKKVKHPIKISKVKEGLVC